ncbi:hypothetical protein M409DRAFT_26221 [Zasmidium cellare ATCC 36951]|uniref:Uncharacterized protein n=1 Tax=Zasmidium cellare ATCC 36951 TaxID=1080233 RepID=A0A6A6C9W3_ZASCE|nr:uncharacterized protein M409DRAFT_26221 [Zasmidium cellare ATCC 36951]KAF2163613.1 hypothetical protein M409DRAFT_26221 [Zasmidium cellare ATCC 36951]
MGLIRDGIGQALGANQVQTGFNGPKMSFSSKPNTSASSPARSPRRLPPKPDYQTYSNSSGLERPDSSAPYGDSYSSRSPSKGYPQQYGLDNGRPSSSYRDNESWPGQSQYADVPPAYGTQLDYPSTYRNDQSIRNDPYSRQIADPWMSDSSYTQPYQDQRSSYYDNTQMQGSRSMRGSGFRPLALSQVEYGDGKPFLRG